MIEIFGALPCCGVHRTRQFWKSQNGDKMSSWPAGRMLCSNEQRRCQSFDVSCMFSSYFHIHFI